MECGLKACIAKMTRQYDFPDKKRTNDSYTHDIERLLKVTGFRDLVMAEIDRKTPPGQRWIIVKDWNEQARYEQWAEHQARAILLAVNDPKEGVLSWIKCRW